MNDRRVTVLQLVDGFATEEASGGAAQFGIQLARHLDPSRYRSVVCGLWHYDTPSEQRWRTLLHREGIETTVLTERGQPLLPAMLRAATLLRQLVARVAPAVINSHFERGDLLGMLMKLTHPRAPHIVRTMHADQQWQTRPWLGMLLNVAAFPWLFDSEVAISQATRTVMDRRFSARLRGAQATLLYNGISSTRLRPPQTVAASRPLDEPRVIIVGRLEKQKGHHDLFAALPEVLTRFPKLELLVVGTGSATEALQSLATQHGIAHAVCFLGQRNDVDDLLDASDVYVSASIWEGFPTVILEAMAHSVPVVATDVSGSRELIRNRETGLLVPMRQPRALAEAIIWMLRHREEARVMAQRARAEVEQYTLEATAQGYDHLYQHILRTEKAPC